MNAFLSLWATHFAWDQQKNGLKRKQMEKVERTQLIGYFKFHNKFSKISKTIM